jgi:glutathione S-transferase
MAFTLYCASGSPYSWRVHLALEHKRADFSTRLISFDKGEHRTPEFLALSPRHQVPVVTDDGFALYESSAIVEYVEDRFPDGPSLFMGDVRGRALVRQWVSEITCHVERPVETLVDEIFYQPDVAKRDRAAIADARTALAVELDRVEGRLSKPWLLGQLSAADFALYPFLALFPRFELRERELGLGALLGPKIRAFMSAVQALPYFERTYPPHWRT